MAIMHQERSVDLPPAQVWAQLLDAGQVPPCSIRTMYRLLAANAEVHERRNQLRHPAYRRPELLATGPNQVWSWDITKLLGPVKWTYYYLYVLLDIFSRYVVGWLLARQEAAALGIGCRTTQPVPGRHDPDTRTQGESRGLEGEMRGRSPDGWAARAHRGHGLTKVRLSGGRIVVRLRGHRQHGWQGAQ